jgi:hypothetical protein
MHHVSCFINTRVGPKRGEVTGGWRKLYSEEIHNLYYPPNIIRVTKSRRIRWAAHAAKMGEIRNAYKILVGKPEERSDSEDLDVDGRIIFKRILGK